MKKTTETLLFILLALSPAACATLGAPTKSVLEALAPAAVDALTEAVSNRWGQDAQVDEPSAGCVLAPEGTADVFGDDDEEFVYVTCRAKAVEN